VTNHIDRRTVLRAAVGAGLGLTGLRSLQAFAAAPVVTALGERLHLIAGVGGNVLALQDDTGLLLVDSGAPKQVKQLQSTLQSLHRGAKVRTVINTHWHLDQTGGNDVFGREGATIIAHAKARQRMATPQYLPAQDRYLQPRSKEALPTSTFRVDGKADFGGEKLEYGYLLEAHTDGDLYVYFPTHNVLAVGDAASPLQDPELAWFEGGWVGGRIDSLAKLLAIGNEQTRVVAATGPVISRAELKTEHDALVMVFDRMSESIRKGMSTADMQRAKLLDGLPRTWANPDQFIYDAHKGMWAHHNTLSHQIV
jgi:glyoxylase-like metal-dependent hydrolase (beta-lactamase superfamily II)